MSRKRTPDQETPETTTESPTADVKPEGQTFADKVGQKKWPSAPDPYLIATDTVAGVQLFESKQDRQMAIKFDEKPSQDVIDLLKDEGYRWNPRDKIWTRPVRPDSARAARIDAEQMYQEVRSIIRHDKGIEAEPEVHF